MGRTTHGLTNTPTWNTWVSIRRRCVSPSAARLYPNYISIALCSRWHRFENFLADMGEKPSIKHSIDRIDNAKGYEPGNCRWATATEQQRNRRRHHWVTAFGERKIVSEWAEDRRCVVTRDRLFARLRLGWGIERAITEPSHFEHDPAGGWKWCPTKLNGVNADDMMGAKP